MFKYLNEYKFRILNFLILAIIAYYSFAYPIYRTSFLILAFANAALIQSITLLIAKYKKISIPIVIFISIIISIEIAYTTAYSSRLSFGGIASIFETNKTEAYDMMSSLTKYIPLFILSTGSIICSFIFAQKEQTKKPIRKFILFIITIISTTIVCTKAYKYITSSDYLFTTVKSEAYSFPLLAANEYLFHWTPSFFYTTTLSIAYLHEEYKLKSILSKPQEFPVSLQTSINTDKKTPKTIFIVIGESSNRSNYSLYEYDSPTTPTLDSLKSINKLLYYKGIAPAPITRDAVPFLLTFGSPQAPHAQISQKNIITLSQDIGYTTYWISNQDRVGIADSPIGHIASQTNHSIFSTIKDSDERDDLDLIRIVDEWYSADKKQIFILHLRGSHLSYKKGYDNVDAENLDANKEFPEYLDYDRSIHHTDRVLGGLYHKYFQKENDSINNILFYTSDHGEIINVGHGIGDSNIEQFKVPFIIFGSSYFNQTDSITNLYTNNNIFNTSNLPYIISEIMGYTVKSEYINKAREEGLYYKQVDRKITKFPNNVN